MSLMKRLLEQASVLQSPEGVLSGQRKKDKEGNLAPHASVDKIDPISVRGADADKDEKKFKSDVTKRSMGKDNHDTLLK